MLQFSLAPLTWRKVRDVPRDLKADIPDAAKILHGNVSLDRECALKSSFISKGDLCQLTSPGV